MKILTYLLNPKEVNKIKYKYRNKIQYIEQMENSIHIRYYEHIKHTHTHPHPSTYPHLMIKYSCANIKIHSINLVVTQFSFFIYWKFLFRIPLYFEIF